LGGAKTLESTGTAGRRKKMRTLTEVGKSVTSNVETRKKKRKKKKTGKRANGTDSWKENETEKKNATNEKR